jgi:hypothetical protein
MTTNKIPQEIEEFCRDMGITFIAGMIGFTFWAFILTITGVLK